MATVLPPQSKRQRLDTSEKARIQAEANEIPRGLGSVRVQFIDQSTGSGAGPAIALPIENATVRNLETLLNSIQGNVGSLSSNKDVSRLIVRRTRMREYPTDLPFNPRNQPLKTVQASSILSQIFIARCLKPVSKVPRKLSSFNSRPKRFSECEQYQDAQLL
jgi:hypothetical protein